MRPRLFSPGTTDFSTRGIGTLADCQSAIVTEERNGIFELELTVPIKSKYYSSIVQRALILAKPNPYTRPQPFFVYSSTKPINGLVTFRCRHISYDTDGIPLLPFVAADAQAAVSKFNTKTAVPSPFVFSTDIQTQAMMTVKTPLSIREMMAGTRGSLVDVYGGEYAYDFYNINLLRSRGQDRGVRFAYGKNILDLKQEENIEAVYTGVLPYWYTETDGLVQGDVQYAPGTYSHVRILSLDLTEHFEHKPTVQQLNQAGAAYVSRNKIGVPSVSLSLEVLPAGSVGIETLEEVHLCDTVSVRFERLGVNANAKVISTRYDVLRERYLSIELGDRRITVADAIVQQETEILARPTVDAAAVIFTALGLALMGAKGGAVRMLDTNNDGMPDEFYVADNADPELAQEVWRFNYKGLAASQNGYNGPFVLGMALVDGGTIYANVLKILNIDASNITTGTLSANFIKGGTIDAENVNVTNINGQNVKGKTIGSTQMADNSIINRTVATDGITNRCIASGSIYTSTCDATIQGYFADVIETQKLYAGNASVSYLRCGILKADGFAFSVSGTPYRVVFNGIGAPLTAAAY